MDSSTVRLVLTHTHTSTQAHSLYVLVAPDVANAAYKQTAVAKLYRVLPY